MISKYLHHQNEISLVISDMGLPKLGGYEAFKKLKTYNPRVKAILASGYLEPHQRFEIFKGGVIDFIQKPYLPENVLKKVHEILNPA